MNPNTQRILLVEDNEDDYIIFRDLLDDIAAAQTGARMEVEWVTTYEAACAALAQGEYDVCLYDVCLLDYRLDGHTGLEILQGLPADNRIPIIVMTGNEDHSADVAAAKAGASDYLVKGYINAPLLERSIRYAMQHKQSELATAQAQRFAQATVDALSEHVAVLDEQGTIVAVNAAWRGFAHDNHYIGADAGVGTNYLTVCETSANQDGEAVAQGIREVMAGHEKFCLDYPCHSPSGQRWFRMCATRFAGEGPLHIVVAHENITEQKLHEQQLHIHSQLLKIVGQAVIVTDREGVISYWNDSAEKIYGWSSAEALGRNVMLVMPTETSRQQAEAIMAHLAAGQSWSGEFSAHKKDGTAFPIYTTNTPILDEAGFVTGIIGVSTDITERKTAEEQLRLSETNLATAQQIAHLGSWVWSLHDLKDLNTNPLVWSDEVFRIFGYQPGAIEVSYQTFINGVHPDDRAAVETMLSSALRGGQKYDIEHRVVRPDGTERFVHELSSLVLDENGQPVQLVGTVQDITERKQVEEELRRSQVHHRAIVQSSLDALVSMDHEGHIIEWNPAAEKMFGYEREFALGRPLADLIIPPALREQHWKGLERYLQTGVTKFLNRHVELSALRADGSEFPIELTIARHALEEPPKFSSYIRDITERKQAASAMARLATIVESSSDAIVSKTLDGIITTWNASAETLYGYSAEEAIGSSSAMLSTADHPDEEAQLLAKIAQGERVVDYETVRVCKDGSQFDVSMTLSPLQNEAGEIIGASGISRDISDRKRAENALRASEERYHSIVANTPGTVYQILFQPDGSVEIPFVNEGCRELFEMEPAELRSNPTFPADIIHPDDRDEEERAVLESMQNLTPFSCEWRIQLPSGKTKWVHGAARPRRLPDGGTLWDGLLTDITTRKEAEAERDRFFTMSLDMLCIADHNGYFKRLNPAFEATLGYSNAELMEKPFLEWVHPDDRATTLAIMQGLDEGNPTLEFVNRYRCRDGSYLWLSWVSAPFEDLIYAAAHDVTSLKNAEAALLKANDELELHVMERTAELATANESLRVENVEHQMTMAALRDAAESLQQAKMEADAANLAKSEFLSRMSHELRTPLNAILGFGQLLEMRADDAKQLQGIEQILKAGRHLLDLINEVLDIARIEAGHLSLSLEAISVASILSEILDLTRPLATARQINLSNEMDTSAGWHVLADQQRLKQVLINLLSNSIKYNHQGGSVFVSCAPVPGVSVLHNGIQCEGRLRISVRDTGDGLSAQEMSRLFQPFERLGAAHTQIEGTGIGLMLCKRLVEAMQGAVGVESEVGQGSTFWVELPLVSRSSQHVAQLEAASGATPETFAPSADKLGTILYIEDNLSNLTLVEQALSGRSYHVGLLTAMQGSVGLELAALHAPDLILLDLHLPDIMGDVVLRRLKADAATRDIPVVILSADATPGQIKRLLAGGAEDYLTKPLNLRNFFGIIEQLLHKDD